MPRLRGGVGQRGEGLFAAGLMVKMRIIANENVSGTVIHELRRRGHDVVSVKETMRSSPDAAVLIRAVQEHRLVVTHDKDFGALAFRWGLPATSGVILFRLSGDNPDADNRRILGVLEDRTDWVGHFSVVTDDRIRIRPLPEERA
jgi:predicted nuclease of predicted toxin-antitoxin system